MARRKTTRGYTLMEVLIAMAILALALSILLGTQASAVKRATMANQMTTASLLGRARMVEIESELMADGFNETVQTDSGDFRSDGFPAFEWDSEVEVVEIDDASKDALLGDANSSLFGGGDDGAGGAFTGNAAFAAYLPMVVGLLPDFINRLGERVRRVTVTVKWQAGGTDQTLTLVQYITNVGADAPPVPPGGGAAGAAVPGVGGPL